MSTQEIAGKKIDIDADGYLTNHHDWSEAIAASLAAEEQIHELTDKHWTVINFMRKEFIERGDVPSLRKLTKESGVQTKELYALFPKGPAKKAARIAGLPKPRGCV